MPKRKTKESSDSNNTTSTEPVRDIQQYITKKKQKFSLSKFFKSGTIFFLLID